jgi:dienelactone hydrolase
VGIHIDLAARAVPEWQATLDALQELPEIGAGGPIGFWGIMLGTGIGVPLTAVEPRITAAVFGCLGHESLTEAAAQITVPVEFLLQWDDEHVERQSGLALFDAFASKEKTLHPTRAGMARSPGSGPTARPGSSHAISAESARHRPEGAGIRGRLRSNQRTKVGGWTHFSVFSVWPNIRGDEIKELEGLLRHIFRFDKDASRLAVAKAYYALRALGRQSKGVDGRPFRHPSSMGTAPPPRFNRRRGDLAGRPTVRGTVRPD